MAEIIGVRTVLAVRNLAVSRKFYQDDLGLSIEFEPPGWAFMARGGWKVMLGECVDAVPAGEIGDHSYVVYVTVQGIDRLYAEYKEKHVPMIQGLADKPWGMREFGIRTPDGHRVMFGESIVA